ncbi:hypothetical protein K440DRAFT_621029 [Wilcoxina mikolae CBS 423.85]|nr:hypothetical protein K440DRAFT_621029 [Wilcoxina mikolae CBS 423.85]
MSALQNICFDKPPVPGRPTSRTCPVLRSSPITSVSGKCSLKKMVSTPVEMPIGAPYPEPACKPMIGWPQSSR